MSLRDLAEDDYQDVDMSKDSAITDDQAWIDVIQQMDAIYADLLHHQVELEEKNTALEDAQRFIQSVMSSMTDILIVCDIHGKIQQVNTALTDITGWEDKTLKGKPLQSLFAESDRKLVADFPDKMRSSAVIDSEVHLLNQEQQKIPLAISCNARVDHQNRFSGLVVTGRSLGELRKAYSELHTAHEELKTAQQQLVQSEKMASLGRLVAGVAHELNNPISFLYANMYALHGYQNKLQQYLTAVHQNVDQDEQQSLRKDLRIDAMMEDIGPLVTGSLEGAERVSEIVQNLQRFSTPQESKPESFDLIMVINRAISWVLKSADFKPDIILEMPPTLMLVNTEGYVHQILINLFQNAIDAIAEYSQPAITVKVSTNNSGINIAIFDNGPGIEEKNLVRVFDPFFTTKPVGSGTGLGLYISYGLATEQCQGDLTVDNHATGGAQFTLSLPREQ